MAFEFCRYLTHGEAAAAREVLAMVVVQGGSKIFSRLASAGELAYLFEILLAGVGTMLGVVGLVRCFGPNALCPGAAHVDERGDSFSNERQAPVEELSEQDGEVTIRLENRHLWLLGKHQCIVTVHAPLGSTQNSGREAWYARGEN